jgi:hypothetical protein
VQGCGAAADPREELGLGGILAVALLDQVQGRDDAKLGNVKGFRPTPKGVRYTQPLDECGQGGLKEVGLADSRAKTQRARKGLPFSTESKGPRLHGMVDRPREPALLL